MDRKTSVPPAMETFSAELRTSMKAKSRAVSSTSDIPRSSNVTSLSPVDSKFGRMFSSRVSCTSNSGWSEILKGDSESWLIFQENEACCARKFSSFRDATSVLVWSRLNFIGLLGCVLIPWIETSIELSIFLRSPKNGEKEVIIGTPNFVWSPLFHCVKKLLRRNSTLKDNYTLLDYWISN